MEKFAVDLDAVLDEFEFHEDQVKDKFLKYIYFETVFRLKNKTTDPVPQIQDSFHQPMKLLQRL